MSTPQFEHVYLSPHLDDAVLSCGGTMAAHIWRGQPVLVITVFAGSPSEFVSTPHTRELAERWALSGDPVAGRREEDLAATDSLGAAACHLKFADCVYRGDLRTHTAYYPLKDDIFGPIHPAEATLHHDLAAPVKDIVGAAFSGTFYAPLGAGGHVDHLIVRALGILLAENGRHVEYYEDFPYAGDGAAVSQAIERWGVTGLRRRTYTLDEAALDAKVIACGCYRSQISTFWADDAAMAVDLVSFAMRAGGFVPGENTWTLPHLDAGNDRKDR